MLVLFYFRSHALLKEIPFWSTKADSFTRIYRIQWEYVITCYVQIRFHDYNLYGSHNSKDKLSPM